MPLARLHTTLRTAAGSSRIIGLISAASWGLRAGGPDLASTGLERIAAHRRGRHGRPQLFAAIVNCGFPEVVHNATALAISETFAKQAGFEWAGSLALGGGGALNGAPLTSQRTAPLRQALDLAAAALAEGRPIPSAAQELFGKWRISQRAYRLVGNLGWYFTARPYGAWRSLKQRPYEPDQGHPRAETAL